MESDETVSKAPFLADFPQRLDLEKLTRSEAKYHRIYNLSLSCIYTTSINGDVLDMNAAGVTMLGYDSLEELKKVNFQNVYNDPKDRETFIKLAEAGPVKNFETQLKRKDGKIIDVLENGCAIRNEEGRIVGFQGTIVNITGRKRMEEALRRSEERYRSLVEFMPDGLAVHQDGRYVYVNNACARLFGASPDQIVGKNVLDFVHPDFHEMVSRRIRQAEERSKTPLKEAKLLRLDGRTVDIEALGALITWKGRPAIQVIFRDITQRKLAEAERLRLTEMKNQFIATVTHELRTPLISISSYLDLVLKNERFGKETASYLEVIKRNTNRLLSLTNDLLDFQRLQIGKLQISMKPVNFTDVLNNSVKEITPIFKGRRQTLEVKVPKGSIHILGDTLRLMEVVVNLLDNASKFTPDGGRITVHVEDNVDQVITQVSDTGIGIRKDDLNQIFEPFSAIKKPTHIKGTGLGLTVAKGLIEAHGGQIWVESAGEGKGATFTFTIPKRRA